MEYDEDRCYLGSLCKRGHDWQHTGKSLKYISCRLCVKCSIDHSKAQYSIYRKNIKVRINKSINKAIKKSLNFEFKGNWRDIVDWSLEDLMKHLESHFENNGYNWENYGIGDGRWSIDHIIGIKNFNFDKPENPDFKRCWDLKNIRPLWDKENKSKGSKINRIFQPMLKLEIK